MNGDCYFWCIVIFNCIEIRNTSHTPGEVLHVLTHGLHYLDEIQYVREQVNYKWLFWV